MFSPVSWTGTAVRIIDQTRLPDEEKWLNLEEVEAVAEAIASLRVRGAPAIGIAAAMGCAVAARGHAGEDVAGLIAVVRQAADRLATTRPTAVNLFWALNRVRNLLANPPGADAAGLRQAIIDLACAIQDEDIQACQAIGRLGADLLPDEASVLTHCNAGALATGGHGTALGVIRTAHSMGKRIRVIADETRPLLQGARLTTWELMRDGIDVTLACDNMAAYLMRRGEVDACLVGADRIAANGDTANKIGTYGLAVLARHHHIPFYVAAPFSTVDLSLADGEAIPIEQRAPEEVIRVRQTRVAPPGVPVVNPAFDVTPAGLISVIITDRGLARAPDLARRLRQLDK